MGQPMLLVKGSVNIRLRIEDTWSEVDCFASTPSSEYIANKLAIAKYKLAIASKKSRQTSNT